MLVERSGVVSSAAVVAVVADMRGVVSWAGTRVGDAGRGAGGEGSGTGEDAVMIEMYSGGHTL